MTDQPMDYRDYLIRQQQEHILPPVAALQASRLPHHQSSHPQTGHAFPRKIGCALNELQPKDQGLVSAYP